MASSYLFAGGGTGGHLYPGIAVARAIARRDPDARIAFLTTDRPLDHDLLEREGFAQVPQPVRPFSPKPWHWPRFWLAWRSAIELAGEVIRNDRPRAVLGLGGYAAAPPVVAAHRAGVATAILNQDAKPGRANRYLAKYARLIALQWEASRTHFAPGAPCQALGCPIRSDFASPNAAAARARLGLDAARPLLLATGASQGARTINEALLQVWPAFAAQNPAWQLLHLTGPADEERIRAAYRAAGVLRSATEAASSGSVVVLGYAHDMADCLAAADAVIARAGASTLAELTALGKPGVLFPYPYLKDRHQDFNADVLVAAGAAIRIDDARDAAQNAGPLRAALERLSDEKTRGAMSAAARALGRIDAADAIADWMMRQPG